MPHRHSSPSYSPSAFFEKMGRSSAARRLLLISLVFPPSPHVGGLRWQRMARYAAERGWELDVITTHPDCIEELDWTRLADLPASTCIYGIRPRVPPLASTVERLWKLFRRLRSKVATADPAGVNPIARHAGSPRQESFARHEICWSVTHPRSYVRAYNAWSAYAELARTARAALEAGLGIASSGRHDAIISSGPPHSAHEAARLVSRKTGLPFVMDLRDLWSLTQRCPESIASPLLLHLARRYERRAVNDASLVVVNTDAARSAMIRAYPDAEHRILTVMNGFDDEPLPPTRHEHQFVVAYAGTIYLDRDPAGLFRGAKRVIDELSLSPDQFVLKFIGQNGRSSPIADIAEAEGVGAFVWVGGSRPRAEALEFLARAAMLVILPQDVDMAIPAKVFEYVQFEAWLLALAERGSATEMALRGTAADVVSSRDITGIARVLRTRYEQYAAGQRPPRIADDGHLSRRVQADILLDAIERRIRPTRVRQHSYTTAR